MGHRKEKYQDDRDMRASERYLRRATIREVIAVAYNAEHPDEIEQAVQDAFLQGWHEAMVARDGDEMEGKPNPIDPWGPQREE